jgi:hypothetical protein
MHKPPLLKPATLRLLHILLPIALILGSGCQALRSAHAPRMHRHADAEFVFRQHVTQEAAKYIGSRYKYGGTSPETGFDCSGFTAYVYGQFGLGLPHQSGAQAIEGQSVPLQKVVAGDLVYFARKGRIFHVALVESNDERGITVIHSTTSRGVIRENISTSDYWRPKIAGARTVVHKAEFVSGF